MIVLNNPTTFSDKESLALSIVVHVSSFLSIVGSGAIVLTYLLSSASTRSGGPNRLIFYMSICDLISTAALFIGEYVIFFFFPCFLFLDNIFL